MYAALDAMAVGAFVHTLVEGVAVNVHSIISQIFVLTNIHTPAQCLPNTFIVTNRSPLP
jgi:hypothetical protein